MGARVSCRNISYLYIFMYNRNFSLVKMIDKKKKSLVKMKKKRKEKYQEEEMACFGGIPKSILLL